MISRTHKIRLVPNKTQEIQLLKACGCSRYAYNWGLALWDELYKSGQKPNVYEIKKQWTANKPEWAYESPKDASLQAILDLGAAFKNFFSGRAEHPKFHKKGYKDSFFVNNDKISIDVFRIRIPKIGWIKMREKLRFTGKVCSITISYEAGQWYVSIPVMINKDINAPNNSVVGVDVGIKSIAVASDGTVCPNDKLLNKNEKKLKKLQRFLSRKKKGSNNRQKALKKLQRFHKRIKDKRTDSIHKFTSNLAKNHGIAVIETLDVLSMGKDKEGNSAKNLKWLRCLKQDTAMAEVHRQLLYKMNKVEKAPKFYASSKTCSRCEHKKEVLGMEVRVYKCEKCGFEIDRDLNAAINLSKMRWATPSKPVESRKD